MQRAMPMFILLLSLVLIAACSSDEANTVDDAVKLLQDLEDNSISDAIDDGLDALEEQDGYRAEIHYTAAAPGASFMMVVDVDADNNLIADVQRGAATQRYYIPAPTADLATTPATEPANLPVIRLDGDQAVCRDQGDDAVLLRDGLRSVLEDALADAIGLRLLAVIDTPDDEADEATTIAGRDATRYWLESRLDAAAEVLAALDNADLQAVQDQAGDFTLDGELSLDEDTAALLALRSHYTAETTGDVTDFEFMVSQWGAVEPIAIAVNAESLAPCP